MSHFIKTECHRILENKVIFVVLVIIPLIVTLLLGYEFRDGVIRQAPTVVCDMDQSVLSHTIIGYFADNDTFSISEYVVNPNQIEEYIRNGQAAVGIVIPEGFSSDVAQLKLPTILMVYDGSSMAISSAAKTKAVEMLSSMKTGAAIKQMEVRANLNSNEALNAAMPITISKRNLYNPTGSFAYFLMPGICLAITQAGIAMSCAGGIRWGEEKEKYRSATVYALGKVTFYSVAGFIVICTSLLILHYIFKFPFRGSPVMAAALCGGLSFSVSALCCTVSALGELINKPYFSIMLTGVLILPDTLFSGYTWPVMGMPTPYHGIAWLLPYYHAADNMRSLFLADALKPIWGDMAFLVLFGIILSLACIMVVNFTSKKDGVSHVPLPIAEGN